MYALGRQPLFQLLGAIIVLLVADVEPYWGIVMAAVWSIWIWLSYREIYKFTRTQ
jgi:hypothetical protein